MKLRSFLLIIILLAFQMINMSANSLKDKKSIEVGIITDGNNQENIAFKNSIEKEVKTLLGSKYKIKFPDEKFLNSNWNIDSIKLNLSKLLNDEDVDIIIGLGPASSVILAGESPFNKPVMAAGNIQSTCYDFPKTDKNTSGIKNFTYLNMPCSPERDMEVFYKIKRFNKLALLVEEKFPGIDSVCNTIIEEISDKYNAEGIIVRIGEDYKSTIENLPEDVDAVYLGPIFKMNKNELENLISIINSKGIPSFSMKGKADVELGIMASVCGASNIIKLSRRIAINFEKIIEGEKVSKLPVNIKYTEQLIINMKTVRQIDFYPSVLLLSEAQLINEEVTETSRVLSLHSVITEALETNLNYKVTQQDVEAQHKELKITRADLLPSIEASVTASQIDKDRAKGSFGTNSEKMVSGNLTFTQLVYSEQAMANYQIQKLLQKGREYKEEAAQLDLILNSSIAYTNVLMAKTLETIKKENLSLTRKNLELAKRKEVVGYSGVSDVYRWESRLATDKIELLYATMDRNTAEIALNQVLNKPLKQSFITTDITIDSLSYYFSNDIITICLSNQKIYYLMSDFLVEESKNNLPELKDMDLSLKAQERFLSSIKRSYYHPTISFQAQTDYILSRGGIGSDFSAPGNIPVMDLSNNPIGYVPMEGMFYEPKDFAWNVGIRMSIPLVSGGSRNAKLQKAKIETSKMQIQKELVAEQLTQQIRANFEKISASHPKIALSKEASETADKNLKITQDFYSKGMVSATELIDAQNAALQAKLFATSSVYEYLIDLLVISRSVGGYYFLSTPEENVEFQKRFYEFFKNKNVDQFIKM